MSARALKWAAEQRIPPNDKLVLMMLAKHMNPRTGLCCPSIKLIARETGLSPATIKRITKRWNETGYVTSERHRGQDGRWEHRHYDLGLTERRWGLWKPVKSRPPRKAHQGSRRAMDQGSKLGGGTRAHGEPLILKDDTGSLAASVSDVETLRTWTPKGPAQ